MWNCLNIFVLILCICSLIQLKKTYISKELTNIQIIELNRKMYQLGVYILGQGIIVILNFIALESMLVLIVNLIGLLYILYVLRSNKAKVRVNMFKLKDENGEE